MKTSYRFPKCLKKKREKNREKKKITEKIEKLGGEVVTNISKNVNLLIVGSLNDETSKMKKAKEYNIEIISIEEFDKKY